MDQYFVVRLLGQGAEGHVLQCQNKATHELLAIKRMEISDMATANLHMNEATSFMLLTNRRNFEQQQQRSNNSTVNHVACESNLIEYKRVFLHRYPAVCCLLLVVVVVVQSCFVVFVQLMNCC